MSLFIENFPDGAGRAAFAPALCDYVEDVVLTADATRRIPIPAGKHYVVFSFDGDVRVKLGDLATDFDLPTATTVDGSGSVLNPGARRIPPKLRDGVTTPTHLILRAPAACKGSIEFYE